MYKAGILAALRAYGISGFMRVSDVYEAAVHRMFKEMLDPRGYRAEECGFVQMLAVNTDPAFDGALKGKGHARQLLQWRIDKHWKECSDLNGPTNGKVTPVILDTTTAQGIEAYKRLGFELISQQVIETGTDKDGFKFKRNLSKEEKDNLMAEARTHCVSSVMIKTSS